MKKDDDFTFFFLWLTPAEEGSQARSHKITLTEFIRLTLDDKSRTYIKTFKNEAWNQIIFQQMFVNLTQFSKGLSINQKILHENIQISTYSAQN